MHKECATNNLFLSQIAFFPRCTHCMQRGLATRKLSVCLSLRLSVRPSVKHLNCDKMKENSAQIFIPHE